MKTTIWLSYDLGVKGDYESLYKWLDEHSAKECGDSLAVFSYEHTGPLLEQLKSVLKKALTIDKRTRIYVVYRDQPSEKSKGSFIFGGRRAAPWTGYADTGSDIVDTEV